MWSGTAAASFRGVRRTPAGVPLPDAVIAVALLAVRYATLATGLQPGGGAISYVTTPFWTLPLAWRRRYPLAVALTVAPADAVGSAPGADRDSAPELLALLLVRSSLGPLAGSLWRLLGGEAALLGVSLWSWL